MIKGGVFGLGALLLAMACAPEVPGEDGGASGGSQAAGAGGADTQPDAGSGGMNLDPSLGGGSSQGDAGATPQGGVGGSDVTGTGGAEQGGAGGSDVAQGGAGGSSQGGAGSSDVNQGGADQGGTGGTDGGAGGSDVGQGGSEQGTGGTEQGGAGGSDVGQGGSEQGGAGGSDVVEPECEGAFSRCNGNVYEECDVGVYFTYQCSVEVGLNCYPNEGCAGECVDDETRCTGETAETCVHGEWTTTEECPFQCLNGACEGTCAPGTVVCDGTGLATCGSDFQYGSPVACPTDPNGTTSCSAGECSLSCNAGFDDCDDNGSCEADLSTTTTCGACGTACDPNPANAAPTCTVSGCGFTCDAGFEDCDGNPANGCELDTRADALNCGACGNSCYGTTCAASQCEFDFEVVSDYSGENARVLSMTLSNTHVYWTTSTELRRAPKGGGAYDVLATLSGGSSVVDKNGIVIEAGKVAWVAVDGVYVMPEAGGAPTCVFQTTLSTTPHALVGANGKLYWNDSQVENNDRCAGAFFNNENGFLNCSGTHVTTFRTYDLSTGVTSSLQLSGEYHSPLGVVGNELYVARLNPYFPGHAAYTVYLIAYDATTGSFLRMFGGEVRINGNPHYSKSGLSGSTLIGDKILYSTGLEGATWSQGLMAAPLSGSTPMNTNTLVLPESVVEFVADTTTVYYRDADGFPSTLQRVSLTGEALDPIFENETDDFIQLAIDDAYIYFTAYTNGGEQAVLRAPK